MYLFILAENGKAKMGMGLLLFEQLIMANKTF